MISDVWQIVSQDIHGRKSYFAPFSEKLVKIPIVLTYPQDGIVLDSFVGVGTICCVTKNLNKKSIGIDLSNEYF